MSPSELTLLDHECAKCVNMNIFTKHFIYCSLRKVSGKRGISCTSRTWVAHGPTACETQDEMFTEDQFDAVAVGSPVVDIQTALLSKP